LVREGRLVLLVWAPRPGLCPRPLPALPPRPVAVPDARPVASVSALTVLLATEELIVVSQ
jgi:hypothetical protein